jgi:hypothetical protein
MFTQQGNEHEGKVGIGKLPGDLTPILDDLATKYIDIVPDKSSTTYHTYYRDLTANLHANFHTIQHSPFWDQICGGINQCIQKCVPEMNEIYYSNPKPGFETGNLYGAAANLIPHRDCLLFHFTGISFYRVIIGLTDGNNDTLTRFVNLNMAHKINRGDYMIFDFDRTVHQVIKLGQQETPRVLLKLHFIVCENCRNSGAYMQFAEYCYRSYYYVARYTEQIGTDPTTFAGFFFGLAWEWPFHPTFKYTVGLVFVTNMVVVHRVYRVNTVTKMAAYSFRNMIGLYLLIVWGYYLRYVCLGIK